MTRRIRQVPATAAMTFLLLTAAALAPTAVWSQQEAPEGEIVRLISVGSVLTADGTIWAYRPDKERWMTIDESFRDEGRRTSILPLPVSPDEISEMITFGFILTDEGVCWLYDIEKNRWIRLPDPGTR